VIVVVNVNSAIWSYKKQKNMKLYEPLRGKVFLPKAAEPALRELIDLHHLENVEIYSGKPPENALSIGGGVYIVPSTQ